MQRSSIRRLQDSARNKVAAVIFFLLVITIPTTGRLENRPSCLKIPLLVMRLYGGSSENADQPRQVRIEDVLRLESVWEFFGEEEVAKMKKKFFPHEPAKDTIPLSMLPELRQYISHRRDKMSRALMSGRGMSESAEDAQTGPNFAVRSTVDSLFKRTSSTNSNGAKGVKRPLENSGAAANDACSSKNAKQPNNNAKKEETASRRPRPKAKSKREVPATRDEGKLEHDLLHYNPSMRDTNAKTLSETQNNTYLGWSQARVAERLHHALSCAGRCELAMSGNHVSIISNAGVELSSLQEPGNSCMRLILKRHVPPISIEATVAKGGVLEMLFYGPKRLMAHLESMLTDHDMPYKPPTDERPMTTGVEVNREKEEKQLAGYISGGGSMADLLEDNSLHDDMAELMGPPSVKTSLLQHQRKALHWMVEREKPGKPLFWEPHVNHYSGQKGWINTVTRTFTLQPPKVALGGMLADEMGLGKTLTVISLIMRGLAAARKEQANDDNGGGALDAPSSSKFSSTLIVCPLSVLYTWAEQLSTHTDGSASVLLYHGAMRPRHGVALRANEIVLTTYSVLASEYVPNNKDTDEVVPSPLHSVRWQRVVLDEAHVIANRHTLQSRAVLALHASARWVVTGTPIQNKIEDVFPMLSFLRVHPLEDFHWFTR
jgi:hypothetical protein